MQTTIGSRGLQFGMVAAAALLLPTFLWPDLDENAVHAGLPAP